MIKLWRNDRINLCKTEIETSNNNLVPEYMLDKVSIRVFVTSFKKFTKTVLKQYFLWRPAISYNILITQQ